TSKGFKIWSSCSGPATAIMKPVLAGILCAQSGKREEGLQMLRDMLTATRVRNGDDHPFTSLMAFEVAREFLYAAQRPQEAEAALRWSMQSEDSKRHVRIQRDAVTWLWLGRALREQKRLGDAEVAFKKA